MAQRPLEPFALERYFARFEFATPFLLGSSDCESMSLGELLALGTDGTDGAAGLHDLWLGYTESRGDPALRAAIAGLYETVEAGDVLVHAGAEEAIYALVRTLLRPGDRAVVQAPCFQSLFSVAEAQGCDVARWLPHEDAGAWRWSLDALDRLLTPGTRALIVNSPHNPTGHQFARDDFEALVALAGRRGAFVFSDEVYRLSETAGPPLPAACDLAENAISLGVLSKSFGLPGLRIGWLATRDPAALDAVAAYKDYLTICNAAPSEFLATLALRASDQILGRTRALLRSNRLAAGAFFARHADTFAWVPPQEGPVAFVRLLRDATADAFCKRTARGGVMLVPSTQFGFGDRHVRVGLGRRSAPEALARLDEILSAPG